MKKNVVEVVIDGKLYYLGGEEQKSLCTRSHLI